MIILKNINKINKLKKKYNNKYSINNRRKIYLDFNSSSRMIIKKFINQKKKNKQIIQKKIIILKYSKNKKIIYKMSKLFKIKILILMKISNNNNMNNY